MTEMNAQSYYLPYQIVASFGLALVGFLLGLFLAWIIWGHFKRRYRRLLEEQTRIASSTTH